MEKLALLGGKPVLDPALVPKELTKWPILTKEDEDALLDVFYNNTMSGNETTIKFEKEFAAWQGTNYAIAVSVSAIVDALAGGVNTVATVATVLHGEYGVEDVCLSLPTLLGNNKVQGRILPKLTDEEMEKLHISANALKSIINQITL